VASCLAVMHASCASFKSYLERSADDIAWGHVLRIAGGLGKGNGKGATW